jgi:hypothetical protein
MDVVRIIDTNTAEAQIDVNDFVASGDDRDTIQQFIEDAEGEFYELTDTDLRISREGKPGVRESYESVTYKLSGHKQYRRSFSHATFDYSYREGTVHLDNTRVLPFDSAEGDEAYLYKGLGENMTGWEDVTDERGEWWDIIGHREGLVAFDPNQLIRSRTGGDRDGLGVAEGRLRNLRLNISYRHGQLERSRSAYATTELDEALTDSQTGSVSVVDLADLPEGPTSENVVLTVNGEHIHAQINRTADTLDIVARGIRGTDAKSHDAGETVAYVPPQYRKAVAARAGVQLLNAWRYTGYLPDTDTDIENSDVAEELQRIWEGTVEALSAE